MKFNLDLAIGEVNRNVGRKWQMAPLIFVIGFALTAASIIFLVGLATRSFVILFDYFGVSHYFLIGIGIFLMALDRIRRQKPGEGFWGMKHTTAK